MEYLSISQTAEKWGLSKRRVQVLCSENRIPGVMRVGSYWAIPADAEKPKDARIRSGKYIKNTKKIKATVIKNGNSSRIYLSTSDNIVYTFHNEKQDKDVQMVALRDDGKLIGYYEKHYYLIQ